MFKQSVFFFLCAFGTVNGVHPKSNIYKITQSVMTQQDLHVLFNAVIAGTCKVEGSLEDVFVLLHNKEFSEKQILRAVKKSVDTFFISYKQCADAVSDGHVSQCALCDQEIKQLECALDIIDLAKQWREKKR